MVCKSNLLTIPPITPLWRHFHLNYTIQSSNIFIILHPHIDVGVILFLVHSYYALILRSVLRNNILILAQALYTGI